LVLVGFAEVLVTLGLVFLWGFFVAIATLIAGLVIALSVVGNQSKILVSKPKNGAILIALGAIGLELGILTTSFPIFVTGLGVLICGIVASSFYLSLKIKRHSVRAGIGVFLIAGAFIEILVVVPGAFTWGLIIGLSILTLGIAFGVTALSSWAKGVLNQNSTRTLRKGIYLILTMIIASSAFLITVRSTTNVIHEQWLENYQGGSTPNLTMRGVVTGIALNHEVNNGYVYHIFPAVINLNVTEFVWGGESWSNQTGSAEYWRERSVTVFFEKIEVPQLSVGQVVKVSGYWEPWLEDSLYSNALVVAPQIEGSYISIA
jgi:hypothetical protein